MLELHVTRAFKKDAKKAKRQRLDLSLLEDVVARLRQQTSLPPRFRDHSLTGNYKNCRECHLHPDWLLIYEVIENTLILHRLGSHSELF
jgi:mRNA interferase YafQ